MPVNLPGHLHTTIARKGLMWSWELKFVREDGHVEYIAHGATWRKQRSFDAVGSWQRIWLRRRGWID